MIPSPLDDGARRRKDLVVVRVPAGLLLGIDQPVVERDLEDATRGGDERQVLDIVFELLQQAFRQTDGFRGIASLRAELDGDLHHPSLGACFA